MYLLHSNIMLRCSTKRLGFRDCLLSVLFPLLVCDFNGEKGNQKLDRWHHLFSCQYAVICSERLSVNFFLFFLFNMGWSKIVFLQKKKYSTKLMLHQKKKSAFYPLCPCLGGCVKPCIVIYQHKTLQRIIQ